MEFAQVTAVETQAIERLSAFASRIVKEHYDPIIGPEQNDYMIALFQSPHAIVEQIEQGSRYFLCLVGGQNAGFMAFFPKDNVLYLSKFYLDSVFRGKGLSKEMLAFVESAARDEGLSAIELNVNRNNSAVLVYKHLGFEIVAEKPTGIGNGFVMDDYIMRKQLGVSPAQCARPNQACVPFSK